MLHPTRLLTLGAVACCAVVSSLAQNAPAKPTPDAQFGNWLYKTPDATVWKKSEVNGNLVFAVDEPPGDYCTLTLFADAAASTDFASQFSGAVAADQKAKDTVKIEADSGAKPSKAAEGFDVLTRSLRSETSALHTLHMYIGGHSGDRFDLAAFQTTSEAMWKRYGAQASQFLMSLKLANSLPADEVARLVGHTQEAPPDLPGFGDAAAPATETANTPAAAAKAISATANAPAPLQAPEPKFNPLPLNKSAVVFNNAVTQRNGKPIDGIKLSQHDTEIYSPSIAVAPNGTIHIAFVEKHRTTYALAVYHRSSSDGGKTWTEAKNLSEDMPNIAVGLCYALADAQGRVYIVWRSGLAVNFQASAFQGGASVSNIVYRVLENGRWSKIKPVSPPGSAQSQDDGAMSYFATVDAAGKVQVVWNTLPDKWHPEVTTVSGTYHQHNSGVGNGLVFQSTLDGTNASTPREIFLSPIGGRENPGAYGMYCDGLDSLTGFADATGSAHFIAAVKRTHDDSLRNISEFELIENGKVGPKVDLPDLSYHGWYDVPALLVDASGRRHLITLYPAGEHPSIRDYVLGSDDEPTVIRQSVGVKGTVDGFQGYQGPHGQMIAVMQMNDSGERANGETYVSIGDGHGWSTPVNVTNNLGRRSFASKQTSVASNVAIEQSYYPGRAAAAYDHEGHLLLLMINNEYGLFSSSAFGVELAGGSSSTPTLQFLRF